MVVSFFHSSSSWLNMHTCKKKIDGKNKVSFWPHLYLFVIFVFFKTFYSTYSNFIEFIDLTNGLDVTLMDKLKQSLNRCL